MSKTYSEETLKKFPDIEKWELKDFTQSRTLGTGTFGRVFLVKHKNYSTPFALKVCKKSTVVRLKQVQHVRNEKTILDEIDFPFTVHQYKTFQDHKNLYFLHEFVRGGEMFSHLRAAGRFSVDTARVFGAEVVVTFEYLHGKNIIYRDLKPENILLDNRGHLKITDFGFAKVVPDRTWTLCGTPEYLAPEIIKSKGYGKEVDWWALGILLFEMLAGYPPFFDENPFSIYEKILVGKVYFPSFFDPVAKDLIKKLLVADRTRRLGNLKGGAKDVKKHKFFKGLDWNNVLRKEVPTFVVPAAGKGEDDAVNFEEYEEEKGWDWQKQSSKKDPYESLFKNFD